MPRVVLTHEGAVLKEYPLNKERITIGRKPHNDIQLDDPTVSGQHAAILMLQNAYVEDLNSTNGVLLNGKKVTRRQLNHGDMIKIGRHELKFIDDSAEEFEHTVIIQPETRSAAAPAAEPTKHYQVRILTGPKSGESINLIKPYCQRVMRRGLFPYAHERYRGTRQSAEAQWPVHWRQQPAPERG